METATISQDEISFNRVDDQKNNCQLPDDLSNIKPQPALADNNGPLRVYLTYSVHWVESDVSWASRWDIYLAMTDVEIHWFSIINSIVVIFFLSGLLYGRDYILFVVLAVLS